MSRTLTDAAGTVHEPAGSDARIVSLVPSITELVVDLGLGDRLAGRTHFCVHPAAAVRAVPSVGGTKKVKLDRLRALAPTHVILNVDENTREMAAEIGAFVPNLVVTHPLGPEDNPALYRLIGGIFGRRDAADELCAAFEAARRDLARAAAALPPRNVLYFCWKEPWMTVSRDTYIARTLALVNWTTLGHDPDARYPEVALTPGLLAEADVVLFGTEPYAFTQADVDAFAAAHGRDGPQLSLIDGEYTSWYGSRAIAAMGYLGSFAATVV